MIYLYDQAIVDDIVKSFNPNNVPNPAVRVIGPNEGISLAAQIQEDQVQFPVVTLTRADNIEVDTSLLNFTKLHEGINSVFDTKNNIIYKERSLPIKLAYDLNVFATNTADMDEIVRELIFKYTTMYFLTVKVPYESKRLIRFGVVADVEGIRTESATSQYIAEGKLHSTVIPIRCEGAVLLSYNGMKLRNFSPEVKAFARESEE